MICWVEVSRKKPMAQRVIDAIMRLIVTSTKLNPKNFQRSNFRDHPARYPLSIPAPISRNATCCGIKPKVISSRSSRSKASINGPRADVWRFRSRMWSLPGSRCTSTFLGEGYRDRETNRCGGCGWCGFMLSLNLDIQFIQAQPNNLRWIASEISVIVW